MRQRTQAEIDVAANAVIEALQAHGAYLRRMVPKDPAEAKLATAAVYLPQGRGIAIDKIPARVFYSLLNSKQIVESERVQGSETLPTLVFYQLNNRNKK